MANLSQDLNLDIFNDGEDVTENSFDAEAPAEELEPSTEEEITEPTEEVSEATDSEETKSEEE